ncbi:hypothetical protein [Bradyrhizobium sp. CCBAU 51627]|uniref:hypothetical protein n=1 Tax=Bradyrhizobium sp. CCBAU 51627 TaxID=1325088 RepID=UPI002305E82C|nr:hypothetical protein [Bradyrhizobium sp. CCBAU 51627]
MAQEFEKYFEFMREFVLPAEGRPFARLRADTWSVILQPVRTSNEGASAEPEARRRRASCPFFERWGRTSSREAPVSNFRRTAAARMRPKVMLFDEMVSNVLDVMRSAALSGQTTSFIANATALPRLDLHWPISPVFVVTTTTL